MRWCFPRIPRRGLAGQNKIGYHISMMIGCCTYRQKFSWLTLLVVTAWVVACPIVLASHACCLDRQEQHVRTQEQPDAELRPCCQVDLLSTAASGDHLQLDAYLPAAVPFFDAWAFESASTYQSLLARQFVADESDRHTHLGVFLE